MKPIDLMISEVATVNQDESTRAAAVLMRDKVVGMPPVIENRRVFGVVTDGNLVVRALADGASLTDPIDRAMSYDVATKDAQAIAPMKYRKVRRLLFTRDDELTGVISAYDVVATMSDNTHGPELSQALVDANRRTRMTPGQRSSDARGTKRLQF